MKDGKVTLKEQQEIWDNFHNNPELCCEPKEFIVGSKVCYEDQNLFNDTMTDYAMIPCVVVFVNTSQYNPGVKYYYLRAIGSKDDEGLNTMVDPTIGSLQFYKIVAWDDPKLHDMTIVENENEEEQ